MPPLIAETEANGKMRLPDFVFTIREAMRERSSCGARVDFAHTSTGRARRVIDRGAQQFGEGKRQHPARE